MQKNLVLQLARFGDILQSRRLIKSLKKKGSLALCVDKTQEKIAKLAYPDIEILPLQAFSSDAKNVLSENKKIFEYVKNAGFEEAYIMNHTSLSYAFARLFAPDQLKGYILKEGQEMRSDWVKLAFKYMNNRFQSPLHIVDYWGFFADEPILPQEVNPSAYEKMQKWQEAKGDFQIAIVLAGQEERRSVPVDKYAQIMKIFLTRYKENKVEILLLGTQKEEALARKFLVEMGQGSKNIKNLVGKTSIEELFSLIKDCDLVISPDTGTLHCAAFLGVPTLSFFFSSAWCFETGAYGLGHTAIQVMPHCAPCFEKMKCNNWKCHEAFSSPSLLARIAGKKTQKEIQDFSILESSFDKVGLMYTQKEGILQQRQEAEILRALLYEYKYNEIALPHSEKVSLYAGNLFDGMDFFPPQKP